MSPIHNQMLRRNPNVGAGLPAHQRCGMDFHPNEKGIPCVRTIECIKKGSEMVVSHFLFYFS